MTKQKTRPVQLLAGLLLVAASWAAAQTPVTAQTPNTESALPKDVFADSRNRLPLIKRDSLDDRGKKAYDATASGSEGLQGAAEIRLHASGVDVRWSSPLGRQLTELTILATGRELDVPYEWSVHEMEALSWGLDPKLIDQLRYHKPLRGADEKEMIAVQMARDIAGKHRLSSQTYARALHILGESNLVDIASLISGYVSTGSRLIAFNQLMPVGMKQLLPLPFTPPNDVDPASRNRMPLFTPDTKMPTPLYSREIAPTGTGPFQIALHQAGLKSLQAHVEPRLLDLAVLVTAREFDQQYEWTTNELTAHKDGLDPAVIDIVRDRKPVAGLGEKETAIIAFGREMFGKHMVTAETYAHALKLFGETDLVDLVNLMTQHASTDALLNAFDQHLPADQKPLLPVN